MSGGTARSPCVRCHTLLLRDSWISGICSFCIFSPIPFTSPFTLYVTHSIPLLSKIGIYTTLGLSFNLHENSSESNSMTAELSQGTYFVNHHQSDGPSASTSVRLDEPRIPRPMNSWLFFRTEKVKELKASEEHGGSTQAVLSKVVSEMWKQETPQTKRAYALQAEQSRVEHELRYPLYKLQRRPKAAPGSKQRTSKASVKAIAKATVSLTLTVAKCRIALAPSSSSTIVIPTTLPPISTLTSVTGPQNLPPWNRQLAFPHELSAEFRVNPQHYGYEQQAYPSPSEMSSASSSSCSSTGFSWELPAVGQYFNPYQPGQQYHYDARFSGGYGGQDFQRGYETSRTSSLTSSPDLQEDKSQFATNT